MVKHIVSWKVKDEALGMKKPEIVSKMKSMLEALPGKIHQIKEFEVGVDFIQSERSFDICLISAFESVQAMNEYQINESHQEVVSFFKQVVEKGVAVDYNI